METINNNGKQKKNMGFKSYYVVWKLDWMIVSLVAEPSLNRTM